MRYWPPNCATERERNAELQNEIQVARNYIADLEGRLAAANDDIAERESAAHGASDDTQPIEPAGEMTADSEFAEAGMFAPIAGETAEGNASGVPVPRREEEAQVNMDLAAHPKLLQIMSLFVRAYQNGQYANYNQSTQYENQVNRLLQAGMLERSALDSCKFRPSPAGVEWHQKHRQRQVPPNRRLNSDTAEGKEVAKTSVTLRSMLVDADDERVARPPAIDDSGVGAAGLDGRRDLAASTPVPLDAKERESLMGIIGSPKSQSARLFGDDDGTAAGGHTRMSFSGPSLTSLLTSSWKR